MHHRQCWGDDRVFYVDETDEVRSLPARWTSVADDDALVMVSAGRSHFRIVNPGHPRGISGDETCPSSRPRHRRHVR